MAKYPNKSNKILITSLSMYIQDMHKFRSYNLTQTQVEEDILTTLEGDGEELPSYASYSTNNINSALYAYSN